MLSYISGCLIIGLNLTCFKTPFCFITLIPQNNTTKHDIQNEALAIEKAQFHTHPISSLQEMGTSAYKLIILTFFCIGFLSVQVSGFRRLDLAPERSRSLKDRDLNVPQGIAPSPETTFDPNESQKRRVRRGSDPIHNKC